MKAKKNSRDAWAGWPLSNGAFVKYARGICGAYETAGFAALKLESVGPALKAAIERFDEFTGRPRAFEETPEVVRLEATRDALWRALWHAWHHAAQTDAKSRFRKAAVALRPALAPCKGWWRHEMSRETVEIRALKRDLAGKKEAAALAVLGLGALAEGLFEANEEFADAWERRVARDAERLAAKRGDTALALRREAVRLMAEAWRIVGSVDMIAPSEASAEAVKSAAGVVASFRLVASHEKASRTKRRNTRAKRAAEKEAAETA